MKKDSITLPYDEEKLAALRLYLEQRDSRLSRKWSLPWMRSTPSPSPAMFVSSWTCAPAWR